MRGRDRRGWAPATMLAGAALFACSVPSASPVAPASPFTTAVAVPVIAPSTPKPTPAPARPVVVLDPGHNGGNAQHLRQIDRPVPDGRGGTKPCNTTGTQTNAGYPEHAFTFDVATRTRAALEAAGVRVVMTRPDDDGVGPCVDERGAAGEKADADAVVSIHADGARTRGSGFHVALADPPLDPAQEAPAHALGAALHDALLGVGFHEADYTGVDGFTGRDDLAGLNLATRPAALVECGNMRNADEALVFASPEGRQRYADALTKGILTFVASPR